jgi:hypothetical protein
MWFIIVDNCNIIVDCNTHDVFLKISRVAKQRITIVACTILSMTNSIECGVQKVIGVYLILHLPHI